MLHILPGSSWWFFPIFAALFSPLCCYRNPFNHYFFYNLHLLWKAIQTFLFVFRIFLYKFWSNAWWPQRNSQIQSIHGWNIHKNEYCNKSQKLGSDGPQTFAQCRQNAKTTTIDILWCNKCEYILLILLKSRHL